MSATRVADVLHLAGAHHGLIDSARLAQLGMGRKEAWRMRDRGVLIATRWRGIHRVAGAAQTPHQRLLGAVWASGPRAVASHRGAAWLWGLDGVTGLVPETSVPRNGTGRPQGVVVHQVTDLEASSVTSVDGIPVTEPTRTLVDLAAVVDTDTLEIAFDSALRQGLTSQGRAEAVLRRLARPGRAGVGGFRSLIDQRAAVDGVTESLFEARLIQVLRRGGLPEPDRQIELHDEDGFIGRFDCGYRPAMVIIEADSVRHHHSRHRFEDDRVRRTRAEAIGWRVPTITWRQLTRQPRWVVSKVESMLDRSGWRWRSPTSCA